jgi:[acyl-carrier-protein] S-malonyltransferase
MSRRLALLCPGQAGQHSGMFDLARQDRQAVALLDAFRLDDACGAPLDAVLHNTEALFSNRCAQPLVTAAILAAACALRDVLPTPTLVLGYSVGEVAAHAVAGALAPLDAVRLAVERARIMDQSTAGSGPQSMLGVTGLALPAVREQAEASGASIAIINAADSFVLGGLSAKLAHCAQALSQRGARVTPLPVSVASHTPLMAQAVAPFAKILNTMAFMPYGAPVLAGIDARRITGKDAAVSTLSLQLAQAVDWAACMDGCAEAGVEIALELGPGSALARMLQQQRHPHIACRAIDDFRSVDGVRKWLESRQ